MRRQQRQAKALKAANAHSRAALKKARAARKRERKQHKKHIKNIVKAKKPLAHEALIRLLQQQPNGSATFQRCMEEVNRVVGGFGRTNLCRPYTISLLQAEDFHFNRSRSRGKNMSIVRLAGWAHNDVEFECNNEFDVLSDHMEQEEEEEEHWDDEEADVVTGPQELPSGHGEIRSGLDVIETGCDVEAYWPDDDTWLAASVTAVQSCTYQIAWYDGTTSEVPKSYVRNVAGNKEVTNNDVRNNVRLVNDETEDVPPPESQRRHDDFVSFLQQLRKAVCNQ